MKNKKGRRGRAIFLGGVEGAEERTTTKRERINQTERGG